jgi:hypothetical protein
MQPSKPPAPVRAASRCVALHWWSHVARQLSAAIPPKSRVRLSFARQERKLRGEVKRRRSVEVSALQTKADSAWLNERAPVALPAPLLSIPLSRFSVPLSRLSVPLVLELRARAAPPHPACRSLAAAAPSLAACTPSAGIPRGAVFTRIPRGAVRHSQSATANFRPAALGARRSRRRSRRRL